MWQKIVPKIKDVIYILLFAAAVIGWYVDTRVDRKEKELIQLTLEINQQEIRTFMLEQLVLNGQIIQYMKSTDE